MTAKTRLFRATGELIIVRSQTDIGNGDAVYKGGIEIEADDISDEYHTMHELYLHRMALNIAFFNFIERYRNHIDPVDLEVEVMKSKMHYDGTMFEGYFIVMAITPQGQISYHYKLEHWDKFHIPEVDRTPEWDGHGSLNVIQRLYEV